MGWQDAIPWIGAGVQLGGSIWGAQNQNQTNQQNYQAQLAQQAMMRQAMGQYMTPPGAQNPYSQMMMQFAGLGGGGPTGGPGGASPIQSWTGGTPGGMPGGAQIGGWDLSPSSSLIRRGAGGLQPTDMGPFMPGGGGMTLGPGGAPGGGAYRFTPMDLGAFTYQPAFAQGPPAVGTEGLNAGQDPILQMMRRDLGGPLQQVAGGGSTQFDTSDLMKSLEALNQRGLDQQVAQLQGSAGSLGQRFGTAANQGEARLRGDFLSNLAAQRGQIGFQAHEADRNRQMQALGLQAGRESMYGQLGLGHRGISSQEQLTNAARMQQLGLANADFANQAGQFNAGQQMQTGQFNANQGNIFNQFMLQAMGQGNAMQQGQLGQNINLLALMSGQQVPQQQPSAWPGVAQDFGQTMMMLPFMQQMMQGQGRTPPYRSMPQGPFPQGPYGGSGGWW